MLSKNINFFYGYDTKAVSSRANRRRRYCQFEPNISPMQNMSEGKDGEMAIMSKYAISRADKSSLRGAAFIVVM